MSKTFDELVAIMDRLREPGGCPWDRAQDLESFTPNIREELDELEEAIGEGDAKHICEELGDVIFNLVFVARLAKERGWFTMDDALAGIRDKIVRRHPHVFGDSTCSTPEEVLQQWARIKEEEKA
jgi:nucleoside triphosphate diphosphatase